MRDRNSMARSQYGARLAGKAGQVARNGRADFIPSGLGGRDERRKFGEDGFESYVARVAALEQSLGIHDLARFTPT
jgi:hypothetical protein